MGNKGLTFIFLTIARQKKYGMVFVYHLFTILMSLLRRISRASRLEEDPVPDSPNTLLVLVDYHSKSAIIMRPTFALIVL